MANNKKKSSMSSSPDNEPPESKRYFDTYNLVLQKSCIFSHASNIQGYSFA